MGFALKHIGNHDLMLEAFVSGIEKVLTQTMELIEYYKKSAKLRMNKKIAEEIAKRIPIKSFPSCIEYNKERKEVVLVREDDLWKTFNEVT